MRRLLVMAVTSAALFGCAAASQYKFNCSSSQCEVETAGPATLDFRKEFGETLEVIETADGRITMEVGSQRKTFAMGDEGTLDSLQVKVTNIKGEQAYFTVRGG